MRTLKTAVLGGDLRLLETAKELSGSTFPVSVFGIDVHGKDPENLFFASSLEEALDNAELLILPLPYSRFGGFLNSPLSTKAIPLESVWNLLSDQTVICAGMADGIPARFRVFDYNKDEEFLIYNAKVTVDGAVSLAIRETDISLFGAKILLTGYGRIGKLLSSSLLSFGASVSVFARNPLDISKARVMNLNAYSYDALPDQIKDADLVINTVPQTVLDETVLEKAPSSLVILDLASLPGGVDKRSADKKGIKVVSALGLPGKFAPKTAGKIIASCALKYLETIN